MLRPFLLLSYILHGLTGLVLQEGESHDKYPESEEPKSLSEKKNQKTGTDLSSITAWKTLYQKEWSMQPYRRNEKYPEGLKYSTIIPDLKVRSKAEADLVSRYCHFNIPFRYEEVNIINGEALAIDFTLLNIVSGRKLYWDHRGLSDDPGYLKKVHHCEKLYLEAGIIPWVNMIVTTETKDAPLDLQWVDTLIEFFLLS